MLTVWSEPWYPKEEVMKPSIRKMLAACAVALSGVAMSLATATTAHAIERVECDSGDGFVRIRNMESDILCFSGSGVLDVEIYNVGNIVVLGTGFPVKVTYILDLGGPEQEVTIIREAGYHSTPSDGDDPGAFGADDFGDGWNPIHKITRIER